MKKNRKTAEAREKDFRLAILRIKRSRSNTGAAQISIASVAREAGVSPALIHNHYPQVADAIRLEQVRQGRDKRKRRQDELKQEREKARALRTELADLRAKVACLASINEVLRFENESLRARRADNVVSLSSSPPNLRGTAKASSLAAGKESAPTHGSSATSGPLTVR
jgi:AcrR family transcriptional regulator